MDWPTQPKDNRVATSNAYDAVPLARLWLWHPQAGIIRRVMAWHENKFVDEEPYLIGQVEE